MKYLDRTPMTFAGGLEQKEKLECPHCENTKFYYNPSTGEWRCERCGQQVKPAILEESRDD